MLFSSFNFMKAICLCALTMISVVSFAQESFDINNLIINGSFEKGHGLRKHRNWKLYSKIPGWSFDEETSQKFELQYKGVGGTYPSHGKIKAELDGNKNASLKQVVQVEAGQEYFLSFDHTPRTSEQDSNQLQVFLQGNLLETISRADRGWKNYTYAVKTQTNKLFVEFRGAGKSDGIGALVDNVKLIQKADLNLSSINLIQNSSFEQNHNLSDNSYAFFQSLGDWFADETRAHCYRSYRRRFIFKHFFRRSRCRKQVNKFEIQYGMNIGGISPQQGLAKLEFDSNKNSKVSQNFSTQEGKKYLLSFHYSSRIDHYRKTNKVRLYLNDQKIKTISGRHKKWRSFHYIINGSQDLQKISFEGRGVSDSLGGYIDNVSIYEILDDEPIENLVLSSNIQDNLRLSRDNLDVSISVESTTQAQTVIKLNGVELYSGNDLDISESLSLNQGINSLEITTTNTSGQSETLSFNNIFVDSINPEITLNQLGGTTTRLDTLELIGNVDDSNLENIEVYLNDALVATSSSSMMINQVINLVEGENRINVIAYDEIGNRSEVSLLPITLEVLAPVVTISTLGNSNLVGSTLSFQASIEDIYPVSNSILINGTLFNQNTDKNINLNLTLNQGLNEIKLVSTNSKGKVSEAIIGNINVDSILPVISIDQSGGGETRDEVFTLTGQIQEFNIELVEIFLNNQVISSSNSLTINLPITLSEGLNLIKVVARDILGNQSEKILSEVQFVILAPEVSVTSILGDYTNQESFNLKASIEDIYDVTTQVFVNDGQKAQTSLKDIDLSIELVEGLNTIRLVSENSKSKKTEAAIGSIIRDTTVPTISVESAFPAIINKNSLDLIASITEENLKSIQFFINSNEILNTQEKQISETLSLTLGDNEISVKIEDLAGNIQTQVLGVVKFESIAPVVTINSRNDNHTTLDQVYNLNALIEGEGDIETQIFLNDALVLSVDSKEINQNLNLIAGDNIIKLISTNSFDQGTEVSTDIITYDNAVNQPPVADFTIVSLATPNLFLFTDKSFDPDGFIAQITYTLTDPQGNSFSSMDKIDSTELDLGAEGIWTFSVLVVDNEGASSEKTENIEIGAVNSVDTIFNVLYLDGSVFVEAINIQSSPARYFINASNESGDVFNDVFTEEDFDFVLPAPGTWTIVAYSELNTGERSDEFAYIIDVLNQAPIASLSSNKLSDLTYSFDASNSNDSDGEIVEYSLNFTSPTGVNSSISQTTPIFNYTFSDVGEWKVKLQVKDNFDLIGETNEISLELDILPPNPGPENDNTLAGIDSDNDGIRDDLENYINDLSFDDDTKSSLKKMVRNYQEIVLESDDETKSVSSNYRQINFDYCLISKIGEEAASQVQKDLKIEQFNTGQRLSSYLKYRNHFAGTGVAFDFDANGYGGYCE